MTEKYISYISQLYHYIKYSLHKPKFQFNKAMFITSIDIDVGSKDIGVINKGENDSNVHNTLSECKIGEIEEHALPIFINFFEELKIPVTFAIRGQLFEVADSPLQLIFDSSVKHDIGSHGYSHRNFQELSCVEAESELTLVSKLMKNVGLTPKSFVFPKNKVAHLQLLEKWGYKCFRGYGDFLNDGMYISKRGLLYDVHPSLFIGQCTTPSFPMKMVDIAVRNKAPFHVWFHLWDFSSRARKWRKEKAIQKVIDNFFFPLFRYTAEKEKAGLLTFETMLSATQKVESLREMY